MPIAANMSANLIVRSPSVLGSVECFNNSIIAELSKLSMGSVVVGEIVPKATIAKRSLAIRTAHAPALWGQIHPVVVCFLVHPLPSIDGIISTVCGIRDLQHRRNTMTGFDNTLQSIPYLPRGFS